MSKLVEKLEQISEGKSQPLGFGAAASRAKGPSMLLVTSLKKGDVASVSEAAAGGAVALLLPQIDVGKEAELLAQIGQAAGEVPWGMALEEADAAKIRELDKKGCDFLIFGPAGTPSALLQEENMGKVLKVDPSMSDNLLRTINLLPIDAVLVELRREEPFLTVNQLMQYQRLTGLVRKPLLAVVPQGLKRGELEDLREVGVKGVVVETGERSKRLLSRIRKAIEALPQERKQHREKMDVVLPLPSVELAEEPEAEPDEEEEDF